MLSGPFPCYLYLLQLRSLNASTVRVSTRTYRDGNAVVLKNVKYFETSTFGSELKFIKSGGNSDLMMINKLTNNRTEAGKESVATASAFKISRYYIQ